MKDQYANPNEKLILDKNRIDIYRGLIQSLRNALARKDFHAAAAINALFANEALVRSRKTLDFWIAEADPETNLFPTSLRSQHREWTTRNAAADLFPFLVIASHFLEPAYLPLLQKTLLSERMLSGHLPRSVNLLTDSVQKEKKSSIIFGASEYCKDGLLSITERIGKTEYSERMIEIIDKLFETSQVATTSGMLPSTLAEVNGEMLQTACRSTG